MTRESIDIPVSDGCVGLWLCNALKPIIVEDRLVEAKDVGASD